MFCFQKHQQSATVKRTVSILAMITRHRRARRRPRKQLKEVLSTSSLGWGNAGGSIDTHGFPHWSVGADGAFPSRLAASTRWNGGKEQRRSHRDLPHPSHLSPTQSGQQNKEKIFQNGLPCKFQTGFSVGTGWVCRK